MTARQGTVALVAATLMVLALLGWLDLQLTSAVVPHGILSFEFATTHGRAVEIVAEWRRLGDAGFAAASLGVDVAFLVLYATVLRRGCRWVGARRWAGASRGFAVAAVVAAGLDLVENLALGALLAGAGPTWLAPAATACATIKFVAAAATIGFLGCGAVAR